jgi:hypothetical protein
VSAWRFHELRLLLPVTQPSYPRIALTQGQTGEAVRGPSFGAHFPVVSRGAAFEGTRERSSRPVAFGAASAET